MPGKKSSNSGYSQRSSGNNREASLPGGGSPGSGPAARNSARFGLIATHLDGQGNHYCHRGDGAAWGGSYRYDNADGSYYYQNANGSTYYKPVDGPGR